MDWIMNDQEDDHLIDDMLEELDRDDENEAEEAEDIIYNKDGTRRRVRRLDYTRGAKEMRKDSEQCHWMWLLNQPDVADPGSRNGRNFRRWFRVPYPLFEAIVDMCIHNGSVEFNNADFDAVGAPAIPFKLKFLMVLRILACGGKFIDIVHQMNHVISESRANNFFKTFNAAFKREFADMFIKPLEDEEMLRSMKIYSMIGLPGCIGSIDNTFVPWESCAFNLKNVCSGDKGQGWLYEVSVTHNGEVIAIEGPTPGSVNDKTSVKYSTFVNQLKSREIYSSVYFTIRTGVGDDDYILMKFAYLICDGGFVSWSVLINGYSQFSHVEREYRFTDWLASVRKDVECFYGRLKQRFRFFINPITLRDPNDITNAFFTACIINNMIIDYDGLTSIWELGVNWKTLDPMGNDEDEEVEDAHDGNINLDNNYQSAGLYLFEDLTEEQLLRVRNWDQLIGDDVDFNLAHMEEGEDIVDALEKQKQNKLRELLANHLHFTYMRRELKWPKTRAEIAQHHNVDIRLLFADAQNL